MTVLSTIHLRSRAMPTCMPLDPDTRRSRLLASDTNQAAAYTPVHTSAARPVEETSDFLQGPSMTPLPQQGPTSAPLPPPRPPEDLHCWSHLACKMRPTVLLQAYPEAATQPHQLTPACTTGATSRPQHMPIRLYVEGLLVARTIAQEACT